MNHLLALIEAATNANLFSAVRVDGLFDEVLTAALSTRDERRGARSTSLRLAVLIAAALAGATGHYGGTLVFGDDFLFSGITG
jgi:hypothetical protein